MKNIVLCGFMGCGKSTIGKLLAAQTDREFIDMDTFIEQQEQRSITTIFEQNGEAEFRRLEHAACVTLGTRDGLVIATGGGAVLREDNVAALTQNGTIVFLDVSEDTVLTRLQHDTSRPLLQRADKAEAVHALLTQRHPLYTRAASLTVDANGDAATVAASILKAIAAE